LSITQELLEESCFRFIERWLPSVLEERGWKCAAAVELTTGLYIIRKHRETLPDGCISTTGQIPFKKLTRSVAQLRHAAVHRLHLEPDVFLNQIHSALTLTEVLQDAGSTAKLQLLYVQVDTYVKKMKHDVEVMEQGVNRTLLQILKQKEVLYQREQHLQAYISQQRIEIPEAAGQALIESTNTLFPTSGLNRALENQSMTRCIRTVWTTEDDMTVDESDIESDEAQLQAELG
jgi:hypothetical protein